MARLVESRKDVEGTTQKLNQELGNSPDLQRRLAYARGWYYLPELDAVGFSKFIGYADMTVERY
ncbi:MAG: hypothetical protein HY330_01270, partial [Chloroflexi bacterium]|nr:hypothetical protein [Chloroflexota bacterium]